MTAVGFVSAEASLLGSQMAAFSVCPRVVFSFCTCISCVSLCPNFLLL